MSRHSEIYRPLVAKKFRLRRSKLWVADDHLLVIIDKFLRETYARLYWNDIQSIVFYSLRRPGGLMLALEGLCVGATFGWLYFNLLWGSLYTFIFLAIYLPWRLTRSNWACQVSTRLSTHRFLLERTRSASQHIVEEIDNQARAAQTSESETVTAIAAETVFIGDRNVAERKRSRLFLYALTFILGLFTPLHNVVLAIYCLPLAALLFIQRPLDFPFSVRAAIVLSQMLTAFQLLWGILFFLRSYTILHLTTFTHTRWSDALRVLFSLFGIAAIYQQSLEYPRESRKSSNILGLS